MARVRITFGSSSKNKLNTFCVLSPQTFFTQVGTSYSVYFMYVGIPTNKRLSKKMGIKGYKEEDY